MRCASLRWADWADWANWANHASLFLPSCFASGLTHDVCHREIWRAFTVALVQIWVHSPLEHQNTRTPERPKYAQRRLVLAILRQSQRTHEDT